MAPVRYWQDLTTTEFDGLDADRTVALLPLGAIEQHGPHLPVSTDALIAEALARLGAERTDPTVPVLVLPTQAVGKSNEHLAYPGTLSLEARTLLALWTEIGESVHRAGVRRLLMLNAHGGQPQVMEMVARELRVRHAMLAVSASWWHLGLPAGLVPDDELRHGIHGGQVETSMVLHLRPDLVRMEHARDFRSVLPDVEADYERLRLVGGVSAGWQAQDLHPAGVAGNASAASTALGEAIVEHAARGLARLVEEVSRYPLDALRPPSDRARGP